jgi:hypothetical protein
MDAWPFYLFIYLFFKSHFCLRGVSVIDDGHRKLTESGKSADAFKLELFVGCPTIWRGT